MMRALIARIRHAFNPTVHVSVIASESEGSVDVSVEAFATRKAADRHLADWVASLREDALTYGRMTGLDVSEDGSYGVDADDPGADYHEIGYVVTLPIKEFR